MPRRPSSCLNGVSPVPPCAFPNRHVKRECKDVGAPATNGGWRCVRLTASRLMVLGLDPNLSGTHGF